MGQVFSVIWAWLRPRRDPKVVDQQSAKAHSDDPNQLVAAPLLESHHIDDIADDAAGLAWASGSGSITWDPNKYDNAVNPSLALNVSDLQNGLLLNETHDKVLVVVAEKLKKTAKCGKSRTITSPRENVGKIGPYTSAQKILLVGEGDFSFSACLAIAFGSASNMVATSLNPEGFLINNYFNFATNKAELVRRGATVLHNINATTMAETKRFRNKKFDCIIYNFPHAGFKKESRESEISRHQELVMGFLKNAKKMIEKDGQIHITHKSNPGYLEWNTPKLGTDQGLHLLEEVKFKLSKYPGYHTKYGFGGDKDYECNPSKTYMFGLTKKEKVLAVQ